MKKFLLFACIFAIALGHANPDGNGPIPPCTVQGENEATRPASEKHELPEKEEAFLEKLITVVDIICPEDEKPRLVARVEYEGCCYSISSPCIGPKKLDISSLFTGSFSFFIPIIAGITSNHYLVTYKRDGGAEKRIDSIKIVTPDDYKTSTTLEEFPKAFTCGGKDLYVYKTHVRF